MKLKLAILDLYNGTKNKGMQCIKDIVNTYQDQIEWQVYDVRQEGALPDTSYDIYISSGGPGSPLNGEGVAGWDQKYSEWIDMIWTWNQSDANVKKHVFFICHSFQMACAHFKLGSIVPRKSMSFGTFPIHQTDEGKNELVFSGLENPFYAADFRRWQFIQSDEDRFEDIGASILALEKVRPHVELERAVMAVRFSDELVGVQFHPEADSEGMLEHFQGDELKQEIIKNHGRQKYASILRDLKMPGRIELTHNTVIPNFLKNAIELLHKELRLAA
ncbi:MAG: GMP synthase [Bacteroidota bacterium]